MKDVKTARLSLSPDMVLLIALLLLGLGLIVYRYFTGLGGVTNLSDGYPWGFWIGIDILAGIALAAGGFVMAGLVHIFGGHRFHPLARPAILTALLGYLMFVFSLLVDLGRPWNLWKAIISWNHASPMFEVAWCVMMYTTVLLIEFLPAVLERLRWERLLGLYHRLVPLVIIALLTLFTFAMTHNSLAWAGLMFAIMTAWEVLMRLGVMPRDKQMPILLIMAGIMFSTMHQSSLGTLFLIVDKLHPLWYSPLLPLLFFVSAVMVAPAMVTFEAMATARVFQREPEMPLLAVLGRAMPYLIGAYLVLRLGDLVARGVVMAALDGSFQSIWWWFEIALLGIAFAIYTTPPVATSRRGLFTASLLVIFALVAHRVGVAIVGIQVPEYPRYIPAWSEVMITLGIFAGGLIAFRLAIHFLPIYEEEEHAGQILLEQLPASVPTVAAGL
jgi:Ni/Fe-hydrogenase subunit HybB-like protein